MARRSLLRPYLGLALSPASRRRVRPYAGVAVNLGALWGLFRGGDGKPAKRRREKPGLFDGE